MQLGSTPVGAVPSSLVLEYLVKTKEQLSPTLATGLPSVVHWPEAPEVASTTPSAMAQALISLELEQAKHSLVTLSTAAKSELQVTEVVSLVSGPEEAYKKLNGLRQLVAEEQVAQPA